ncbi:unnamed protein product [Amoebophrya sp. A120]|nr:unnamed protein product [Amoebophrya sp. A120]|eukprot:GSA120T00019158001.1
MNNNYFASNSAHKSRPHHGGHQGGHQPSHHGSSHHSNLGGSQAYHHGSHNNGHWSRGGGAGHPHHSYSSGQLDQHHQSRGQDRKPRGMLEHGGFLDGYAGKKSNRRNSLSRDSDGMSISDEYNRMDRSTSLTAIDCHTSIPEDLYRRMEHEANLDRGVHVPKKKSNGDCVLVHTGVY